MPRADRPAFKRALRTRPLPGTAALLAAALAVSLAACGSSGKGLIPGVHAGPLLGDFEEVTKAAEDGSGNCSATEAALAKTKEDFAALPTSVDQELRTSLHQGISNLSNKALQLCAQPSTSTTKTTPTTPTKTTPTTPTKTTPTTPTKSTPTNTTPPSTTTTPPSGGGTPAPGEEGEGSGGGGGGAGSEGAGAGAGGGGGAGGGASEQGAGGAGAGEAGK